jgi:tRNA 2-thiouridine synthesizing protein E
MATLNPMVSEGLYLMAQADAWTEQQARVIAAEEGIEMTPAHWEVVHFVREQCELAEGPCNARKIIRAMQERFRDQGGKRYLYSLFPGGPVKQAVHIAGLPMPPETLDLSFGTVH